MGEEDSPVEQKEGLKPVAYAPRPVWYPRYTDMNGRPIIRFLETIKYNDQCEATGKPKSWWRELGYPDKLIEKNKFAQSSEYLRENDPIYYDPPVENSFANAFGLDSKYNRNYTTKETLIEPLASYQDRMYRASHQYKQIAEKFNISPEHPGFHVASGLEGVDHQYHHKLGTSPAGHWYKGPRFFEKPLNEGCLEKALAVTKYGAAFGIINLLNRINMDMKMPWPETRSWDNKALLKKYWQVNRHFLAMAFFWGSSLCLTADLRKRDDVYNHWIVGPATGGLYAILTRNYIGGVAFALLLSGVGCIWHIQRTSPAGLWTGNYNMYMGALRNGPLFWKNSDLGKHPWKKDILDY